MDKSRQQFEEWFATQREEMKKNGLGMMHINRMHQRQLSAWQASRESLEIELPSKTNPTDPFYDSFDLGFDVGISQCRRAIISSGVKIKNE